jgi:hypothetical protein
MSCTKNGVGVIHQVSAEIAQPRTHDVGPLDSLEMPTWCMSDAVLGASQLSQIRGLAKVHGLLQ